MRVAQGVLPLRITILSKLMIVGTMFSFALPILHMVIAIYMWTGGWVDRYTYLRRIVPPPASHDRQMTLFISYFFPLAILLHATMATKFLGDICNRGQFTGPIDPTSTLGTADPNFRPSINFENWDFSASQLINISNASAVSAIESCNRVIAHGNSRCVSLETQDTTGLAPRPVGFSAAEELSKVPPGIHTIRP